MAVYGAMKVIAASGIWMAGTNSIRLSVAMAGNLFQFQMVLGAERILVGTYSVGLAFFGMEFHLPSTFPLLKDITVLL